MFRETFVAEFSGVLSRYKEFTFKKPHPRMEKGETYMITIDDDGKTTFSPVVVPK
jgi:hypothetical protein